MIVLNLYVLVISSRAVITWLGNELIVSCTLYLPYLAKHRLKMSISGGSSQDVRLVAGNKNPMTWMPTFCHKKNR